jgi:hypothetical protein
MNKSALLDIALEKLAGDMDDLEGSSAMSHSAEECPDPLGCKMHDGEMGDNLTPAAAEKADGKPILEIEVKSGGLPSMEGAKDGESKAEEAVENADGLSADEAEELFELLKKK